MTDEDLLERKQWIKRQRLIQHRWALWMRYWYWDPKKAEFWRQYYQDGAGSDLPWLTDKTIRIPQAKKKRQNVARPEAVIAPAG